MLTLLIGLGIVVLLGGTGYAAWRIVPIDGWKTAWRWLRLRFWTWRRAAPTRIRNGLLDIVKPLLQTIGFGLLCWVIFVLRGGETAGPPGVVLLFPVLIGQVVGGLFTAPIPFEPFVFALVWLATRLKRTATIPEALQPLVEPVGAMLLIGGAAVYILTRLDLIPFMMLTNRMLQNPPGMNWGARSDPYAGLAHARDLWLAGSMGAMAVGYWLRTYVPVAAPRIAIITGPDGRERWNPALFTRGTARLMRDGEAWDAGLLRRGTLRIGRLLVEGQRSKRLSYHGESHMLLFGPTRSGKGTGMVIPTLLRHRGSALIIDPKGQNCAVAARQRAAMGQPVFALNPFGLHGIPSARFNPLDLLTPDSPTLVSDAVALAEALIFGEPDGRNAHFHESAQDLLAAIMLHTATHPRYAGQRTLHTVRRLVTLPPTGFRELIGEMLDNQAADGAIIAKAGRFLEEEDTPPSPEMRSIQSTAINQTRILDVPQIRACLGASDFAFADLKRRPMTVFLILPPHQLEPCSRWLRLMVTLALMTLTRTPGKPKEPVLFGLDEAASLGNLRELEKAVGLLAGAGLKLFLIFQDLPQLKHNYRTSWESFIGNAGLIQVMKPNDVTTAEYFSKRAGMTTRNTKTESEGRSVTEGGQGNENRSWNTTSSDIEDALVPPTMLYGLPPRHVLTFVEHHHPLLAELIPYYQDPSLEGRADPDPEQAPVKDENSQAKIVYPDGEWTFDGPHEA